ncbi:16S rRNA (uracil(1498)-N(3))-methyltransferase [Mycoplasmopsis primatum]|uniref:16S rRNA (uracil(1498)-N(3))-methyltransferase n=1 Tax=Mycoplasmopsis primatum TaxID=55604 RepID=UPI0004960595|nr:16S rRNA (uracil(1498)-N(3))-methyltransferase [Mycoplasmopsis primatum]
MHKFFVDKQDGDYFILDDKVRKHIKSARLQNDNFLCNYNSEFFECFFDQNNAKIVKKVEINNEFNMPVILAAPIIKIKRFEWLIQKATELGATKIIPMNSEFVDQNLIKYEFNKKLDRFNEIIKNAAEQSFRNVAPELVSVQNYCDIILKNQDKNIYIAYENEDTKNQLNDLKTNCILIVGPEGGFSTNEIDFATKNGCKIVSLGKTILRAETACIAMLSNIRENNQGEYLWKKKK